MMPNTTLPTIFRTPINRCKECHQVIGYGRSLCDKHIEEKRQKSIYGESSLVEIKYALREYDEMENKNV